MMCTKLSMWNWFVALWQNDTERKRVKKITPKSGTATSEVRMPDDFEIPLLSLTPQLSLESMSFS
jgi:hypothetical protein